MIFLFRNQLFVAVFTETPLIVEKMKTFGQVWPTLATPMIQQMTYQRNFNKNEITALSSKKHDTNVKRVHADNSLPSASKLRNQPCFGSMHSKAFSISNDTEVF